MSEQQPELRWAPIPPKPSNARRIWLIVGLSVAALAIVAALLFFLLPRGAATPDATPSPTSSATPTPSASPTQTPTTSPSPPPVVTPPPVADPDLGAFRTQVSPWLGDALIGLDIVSESSGQDALGALDTLQEDAQRLSGALPPASIESRWREGVLSYSQRLQEVRAAVDAGSDTASAVDAAISAVGELDLLVGR